MAKVKTLILRAPGTNCNAETAFAFEQAGSMTASVHVNRLINREVSLADYQIFVIPGGFTYGDDIAAGKVLANQLDIKWGAELPEFIKAGGLIIGICNGFQVLVKAGLLPEPGTGGGQTVTLTTNDSARFECRWIHLAVNQNSPCVFTRGIEKMYLPVAHGEGKFIAGRSCSKENVVLTYSGASGSDRVSYPDNPNGSEENVAGICDKTGRVFALMPHPERYVRITQNPQWTRLGTRRKTGDGLQIFRNAVRWARSV